MIEAIALTIPAALVAFRVGSHIRHRARRKAEMAPQHPPEGYDFGDPASPTRAERQLALWGWDSPGAPLATSGSQGRRAN